LVELAIVLYYNRVYW